MSSDSGRMGCVLVLALPWIIYVRQGTSCTWQSDAFTRGVSHHLTLSIIIASLSGRLGLAFLELPFSGILTKMQEVSVAFCTIGLAMGLLSNSCNLLLLAPLPDGAASLVLKFNWVAWMLCVTSATCTGLSARESMASMHNLKLEDIATMSCYVQDLPTDFMLLLFTFLISRICAVARQRMFEVAENLPCDPLILETCVHEPCANLLKDVVPKLSTCGWPLVLMAPSIVVSGFHMYGGLLSLWSVQQFHIINCPLPLQPAARLAALMLAVAVGPVQLSAALRNLESRLNEQRCSSSKSHLQIEAVEAMLNNSNHRQGWGIPVCDGFVLTTGVLQTVCFRLALAGTVLKAFVDSAMGIEEAQDRKLMLKLTNIQDMLSNITFFLRDDDA